MSMRVCPPQHEGYVLRDLRVQVAQLSTQLSSSTLHNHVLSELRAIERKMGLVLTLFKASSNQMQMKKHRSLNIRAGMTSFKKNRKMNGSLRMLLIIRGMDGSKDAGRPLISIQGV